MDNSSKLKPVETKALVVSNGNETVVRETGNTHKQVTDDKGIHCNFL
jgi:hypothetical protein